jgi:sporulation protein YunB
VIDYFDNKVNEILLPMAESKTRKVVTMIINSACEEEMISDNLYEINRDSNNEIKMITYNSFEVTKLINQVTSNIEKMISYIENNRMDYYGNIDIGEGGVIAEIPFGVIFGNSLLSNIGPKIKLRLNLLGDITSNIETEVKPYGINNAYVELRIHLEMTARVVLPFVSEKIVISNVIPLSMNIVQGSVPEAYISSYK